MLQVYSDPVLNPLPPTIEGELLGLRPRTVVWTKKTALVRRCLWNILAFAITAMALASSNATRTEVMLFGFIPVAMVAIVFCYEQQIRCEMRLLRYGLPARGRFITDDIDRNSGIYWHYYAFETCEGTRLSGRFRVLQERYQTTPTAFTILYDEANPRVHRLYSDLTAAQVLGK